MFEAVKKYLLGYAKFTRRDGVKKLSSALAVVGMVLLAVAFVRTEPVLAALYASIGAVAAASFVSRRAREFVYDNEAAIFVVFLLLSVTVFAYVAR